MEKRPLGRSGLDVTVVTMGCWQAGGQSWNGVDDKNSVAALQAAREAGINFFDTAEGYGEGHSEEMLARALEGYRDEVLIASKVSADHYRAEQVRASCEASLKYLRTDRIDLYQLHWPPGAWGADVVPLEETMGEMMKLQQEGKIRAIGVSNFDSALIEETLKIGRIESLQPPYSLFWRPYEFNGTIETCRKHDIGVITYSPLAQGLLTGKFHKDNRPQDNRSGNILYRPEHYDKALAAVEQLKPIATRYNVTTGQLALQWLLGQPGITSVIVGARNAEQVAGNAKADGFTIAPEDRAEIDSIGRIVTDNFTLEQTNMWA